MSKVITAPPRATEAEAIALNESGVRCELIDGVIVRENVGRGQAYLALALGAELVTYLKNNDIGHICGADLIIRFAPGLLLLPDLSFTSWERCGGPTVPSEAVADIIPNLAVEVFSPSNRAGEMRRKIDGYFAAGVELVWIIDPATRSAKVYTSPSDVTALAGADSLDGGAVLPGFTMALATLFARLR